MAETDIINLFFYDESSLLNTPDENFRIIHLAVAIGQRSKI